MLRLWPRPHRESGPFVWSGGRVSESSLGTGRTFRIGPQPEAVSRNHASEWDALSGTALNRKLRPGIMPQSGMRFPLTAHLESASQFERSFRDTLSARSAIRKVRPVLSVQPGTRFPLAWPLGKRGPDRGMRFGDAWPSSSYSSISLSHVGSAVCRMPAVCSFLTSIPAERTSFMVKRSRGWP